VNFQYDALGRRVARSGTGGSVVFVQMDQQTIADYPVGGAATTPTFRYVYASYIDEPVVRKTAGTGGTLVYFHRNHQFSITAITTSSGTATERYAYSPYGLPTILDASGTSLSSSAISNRYTYTGRELDSTLGLHHFRARWMSGLTGRFLNRDPIGFKGSRWNFCEFLHSQPLTNVDFSGEALGAVGACALVAGAAIGGCLAVRDFLYAGTHAPNAAQATCLSDLKGLMRPGYCSLTAPILIHDFAASPLTVCHSICRVRFLKLGPNDVDCGSCQGSINTLMTLLHECIHAEKQACGFSSTGCGEFEAYYRSKMELLRDRLGLCTKLVQMSKCGSVSECQNSIDSLVVNDQIDLDREQARCTAERNGGPPQLPR
jgi:RHS repeat-associated protein